VKEKEKQFEAMRRKLAGMRRDIMRESKSRRV
jgi:hypothetical protein